MARKILMAIGIILSVVTCAMCQETPAVEAQAQGNAYAAQPKAEKTITSIEIKGNKSISTNTIMSKLKTKVGNVYQENVISDDLKRLYLLGFFEDIKIDNEDYKDGLKIIIKVQERPIIDKISFSGMRRIATKDAKLKEQLKSKETQYLDYPSLEEDVQILMKMYEKKGYSQVQIEHKVDIDKATNKANIQYVVTEGKRIKIRKISIEGNTHFSDARILKLLKTKRAWFFNAGTLKDDVFKEDLERVKSFYQKEGYIDVTVSHEIKIDPKDPFLYITITVVEGKKYLVGTLSLEGNKELSEKEVLSKLSECIPGKVFSQEAMKQDIANIQGAYFDKGYISAQVQELTSINSNTGRVDIVYNIKENDIAYVNKIKIQGNVKTRDVVIRRELRIKPGDRFDGAKLKRSKERLRNLGFFDENEGINYDTEDTDVPNKKDLVVNVKETKTGTFTFGGGYSTVDQFMGFFEVEQKNFDWKNWPYFTGAGQDLRFRTSIGSVSNSFDLSFTNPWIFDYPVSGGFDAYRRTHDRDTDVGYGYDEEITGGDLRLGKEFAEYFKGTAMYRLDSIKISNISDSATQDLKSESGTTNISSGLVGLTFDNRDNVFDTTRGNIVDGSIEVAGGPFGGDKDFIKYLGRASHFVPLLRNSALEIRGRIGLADPYGDSDKVPLYERFFAGGASTVRGYRERRIGPVDDVTKDPVGGESMLIGNLEYTYPVYKFFKLAAFYDVGNVWSKVGDIGSGGFKSGLGLGVRVKTPIGPIWLDYGIPLDKESGEEDVGNGRFHFGMKQGF